MPSDEHKYTDPKSLLQSKGKVSPLMLHDCTTQAFSPMLHSLTLFDLTRLKQLNKTLNNSKEIEYFIKWQAFNNLSLFALHANIAGKAGFPSKESIIPTIDTILAKKAYSSDDNFAALNAACIWLANLIAKPLLPYLKGIKNQIFSTREKYHPRKAGRVTSHRGEAIEIDPIPAWTEIIFIYQPETAYSLLISQNSPFHHLCNCLNLLTGLAKETQEKLSILRQVRLALQLRKASENNQEDMARKLIKQGV